MLTLARAFGRIPPRYAAIALTMALGLGAATSAAVTATALAGLVILSVAGLALLVTLLDHSPGSRLGAGSVLRWTLAAFAVHLLLSMVIHSFAYEQSDAFTYHRDAVKILAHWEGGTPLPVLPEGKEGYYFLLAGLFWLFGPHNLAGLIVNAAFAAALVPVVTDLTGRLFGEDAARPVPALVVLLPGLLLWTSQLLKEAAVILLVAVALNCACRMRERLTAPGLLALAVAVSLLFSMRSHVALMLAVGLTLAIALSRPSLLSGVGTGLAALAAFAVLVVASGVGYSGYEAATSSDLEQANLVRQDLATSADSGFGADADISTPAKAISHLPEAAVGFLLGPYPWQIGGGSQLLAVPDVAVWWLLLPSLWRGVAAAARKVGRAVLLLLLPALMTTALLSLAVANYGTLVRERSQVVIMLVPLVALGLAERANRRSAEGARTDAVPIHTGPADGLRLVGR